MLSLSWNSFHDQSSQKLGGWADQMRHSWIESTCSRFRELSVHVLSGSPCIVNIHSAPNRQHCSCKVSMQNTYDVQLTAYRVQLFYLIKFSSDFQFLWSLPHISLTSPFVGPTWPRSDAAEGSANSSDPDQSDRGLHCLLTWVYI